jgi:DeoR/GlpR family transcriptional regulator of sugar metabolism
MFVFVQDRQSAILTQLSKRPRWTITSLQRTLRVSRSTLRRDLIDLQERGEVLRVHGGVMHVAAIKGEPSLDKRARQAMDAKRAIAAETIKQIPAGATVFIDAGTTCLEVGRRLLLRGDVKMVTHSIRLLAESEGSKTPITCIGGEYRAVSQAVVGGFALDWMNRLHFDVAILGASGLSAAGPSTTEITETAMKQAAIHISKRTILAAHAEKWEMPAAVRFADWSAIDQWVTDASLATGARQQISRLNVQIRYSEQEET